MADDTSTTTGHKRRESTGRVYDPARDRWEDRSSPADLQHQHQISDHPAPSPAVVDTTLIASKVDPTSGTSDHDRKLTADQAPPTQEPQRHPKPLPPSPTVKPSSPIVPTNLTTAPPESDKKSSQAAGTTKTPRTSKAMTSPTSSEAPRSAADAADMDRERNDAIASPRSASKSAAGRSETPGDKKRGLPEEDPAADKPKPADRPVSKRKRLEERHQKLRRRGRTPPPSSVYSRRDAEENGRARNRDGPGQRSPSPLPPPRPPTPEEQTRQRKRPGGGARMGIASSETLRRRQEERDRAEEQEAMRNSQARGLTDVVRQHYNAVPQRGREWRKTESKIKGLRTFNNWVKSTLIQKFSPDEEFLSRRVDTTDWADGTPPPREDKRLLVLDLGCGKGGDLGKWQLAPQTVDLYVGLDPANISISQARERYHGMRSGRGPRGRGRNTPIFHAEFNIKDCFGSWLGDIPIVQQVGIDANAGPGGSVMSSRWGGGGFDVVASMFAIHYAFESEEKTRQMLRNVAGCLKKGGRFLGVCPNSDVISAEVAKYNQKRKEREASKKEQAEEAPEDGEVEEENRPEWGNGIYRVRFPGPTPDDGVFRPPFGWKYSYFMEEAVEEIPEYVVPWEAFRALTEDYNLELQYRKPFLDIWRDEKDDAELGPLSERMGVRDRGTGALLMTQEEQEAASFYHAFCFYKV